jgi:cytochrome b subunit of formate dehydrogenase
VGGVASRNTPFWLAAVAWVCACAPAAAVEKADCFLCHGDKELTKTGPNGRTISLFVDEERFGASVHGKLECASCHTDTTAIPHPDGFAAKRVSCAQCHKSQSETYGASVHGLSRAASNLSAATCKDCHGDHDIRPASLPTSPLHHSRLPLTCGVCHAKEAEDYQRSVHGKALAAGKREAPACTDCHSEHRIEALHGVPPMKIAGQICGQCHASERLSTKYNLPPDRVKTFFESYHGLAARLGSTRAANCASCHGWHDVLPSSDPDSSVNPANLPAICGACHPAIGTRLAGGPIRIHAPPGAAEGKPWIVNFVSRFYITIIVLIVGAMLLHNGLDYLAKTRAHIRRVKLTGGEQRMSSWARAQHFALIVLFVLLAYTGFVHKYPDAVWSWPFHALPEGNYWRGMIHRVSGWLFVALLLIHLVGVAGTKSGRGQLKELWFRKQDFKDLWRRRRSQETGFGYVEKIEYWALVWGSVVMILTGLMLIFTELVLHWLPKVWLDLAQVIHYYEAVLATLAIIVWHFYAVIFDPHEYPMNPAWLIGKKPASPKPPTGQN